jgi:hypothetical protein
VPVDSVEARKTATGHSCKPLATRRRKNPRVQESNKTTTHRKRVANFADTHAITKICNTFALYPTHFNPLYFHELFKTILDYKLMIDSMLNIIFRNI